MDYKIYKAAVIGAGTMGAALAAHLANAGVPVTLLDIVPRDAPPGDKQARDKIVNDGWQSCLKARPANLMSSDLATFVTTGNLEDDFSKLAEADWIIEAIVENLKIKQGLMERIEKIRKPGAIISTNTSGIPVKDIAEGRTADFKKHFLGTHFFNPPRYLKLLEIIPTTDTLPAVIKFMSWFGEYRLGKGIVLCKDTPNFIGNRLALGTGAFALNYFLEKGYTVDEVDALTGPIIGNPKTATFRLIDLVGVDVWEHVSTNLRQALTYDKYIMPYLDAQKPIDLIHTMVERKWLGNKTRIGFYKEVRSDDGKKEFWPLDLQKLEHVPPDKPRFDSVGKAKNIENLGERLKVLVGESDRAAQLVRDLTYQGFQYASLIIPEVADTPMPVDDAIRWGFMHEAGPFETWDMLGVADTVKAMKEAGFPAAQWVSEMLKAGCENFYKYKDGTKVGVYDVTKKKYASIKRQPGLILLSELRQGKKEIAKNAGASLFDIGDGVALVEFHTKMNAIDDDIMTMVNDSMDRVLVDFDGLVVGNEADAFCAGANIAMILMGAKSGAWEMIDQVVRKFQDMNMRMRYFPKPVVIAPAGLALGGGGEITMHGSRVVAASELYIGQVELGVGVIPAGGGTKEFLRRIVNPGMRLGSQDAFPFLMKVFEAIGMAKVATSAWEALQIGFLTPVDRIVLNRDHLLAEAKREVMHMAATNYHPPAPELIYAAGRDALANLNIGTWGYKEGGQITAFEEVIGNKLANIMTGGDLSRPTWVSEQYILDLEREAFLSLCGEEKTHERMYAMLQTGKPLRN